MTIAAMPVRRLAQVCLALLIGPHLNGTNASPILDQEHDTTQQLALTVANDRSQIQSFTVGRAGRLDRIEVEVQKRSAAAEDLRVALWTSDASGLPIDFLGSTLFGSGLISGHATFIAWNIGAEGIDVDMGDMLAIVLDSDAPNNPPDFFERFEWAYGGHYDRGMAHTRPSAGGLQQLDQDFQFRTFVVPEPGSLGMVMFALGFLWACQLSAKHGREAQR